MLLFSESACFDAAFFAADVAAVLQVVVVSDAANIDIAVVEVDVVVPVVDVVVPVVDVVVSAFTLVG